MIHQLFAVNLTFDFEAVGVERALAEAEAWQHWYSVQTKMHERHEVVSGEGKGLYFPHGALRSFFVDLFQVACARCATS